MDNKISAGIILKKRIYTFSFLIYFLNFLVIWNFFSGVLILALRTFGSLGHGSFQLLLSGIPIGLLIGILQIFKNPISSDKITTLLDCFNNAGGVLISLEETGDQQWQTKVGKEFKVPEVKLELKNHFFLLLISFLFLLAVLRIQIPSNMIATQTKLDLKNSEQKSTLKIEALEETGLIEEKEAEKLKAALEQISSEADGREPSRTFESLDNLESKIGREAEKGLEEMQKQAESLRSLEKFADRLQKAAEIGPQEFQIAKNEMKAALKEAMGKNNSADKVLKHLSDSLNSNGEELSQATKKLQEFIQSESKKAKQSAERLMKARVIDKATFEKLKKAGKIQEWDGKKAMQSGEFVIYEDGDKQGKGGLTQCNSGSMKGQNGGVSNGPGSSKIEHNRISSEHDIKFKNEVLPAPALEGLENSQVIGVGMAVPEVNKKINDQSGPVTRWSDKNLNKGLSHLVLPKHRAIVRDYFNRETPTDKRQE